MNLLKKISTTVSANWFLNLVHKFILALFVLSIGILIWKWRALPPLVPIWYSRPWGASQLASPYWLLILPLASIAFYAVDLLVSIYVTSEYLIFTQILFLSSLIVSVLSFVALLKIIFLVT